MDISELSSICHVREQRGHGLRDSQSQGSGLANAANDAITLMARPSAVPGREVLTRIAYNGAAHPLAVSEAGWAPATSAAGKPIFSVSPFSPIR